MAIRWKSKLVLFKTETAYGTDPTPTGALNAILCKNVTVSPMEGEDVSRELEFPYMAAQGTIPAGLRVRLRAQVELQGSGTVGEPPAWGPLLRACGITQIVETGVSVTYLPISDNPESGTLWFWVGNTKQIVRGCRGTATYRLNAQGIAVIELDIQGLYSDPAEAAPVVLVYSKFQKPTLVTMANTPVFTVNEIPLVLREFSLALNNQVEPRLLVGREEIIIVDRAESLTARVEAVPMTVFNPFVLAKAQTTVETKIVHGTAPGLICTLAAPTGQIGRMPDYENNQNVLEWNLPIMPLPDLGNDQWSLTLT